MFVAGALRMGGNLHTDEFHEKWNCIRQQSSLLQSESARELTKNAGIPRGGMRYLRNRAFSTVFRCRKYCYNGKIYNFSTFERGENPLFDGWALFISLEQPLCASMSPLLD